MEGTCCHLIAYESHQFNCGEYSHTATTATTTTDAGAINNNNDNDYYYYYYYYHYYYYNNSKQISAWGAGVPRKYLLSLDLL